MNNAKNLNLSLLSQSEIDTLVSFLLDKKNSVDSSVLSQSSIDKLIDLIRYDSTRRRKEATSAMSFVKEDLLDALNIREDSDQLCELRCDYDSNGDYITLMVYNTVTSQETEVTPAIIIGGDDDETWGRCISPSLFAQMARALGAKYTQKTYDFVSALFCDCMYGDVAHTIPMIYLPDSGVQAECLIDEN